MEKAYYVDDSPDPRWCDGNERLMGPFDFCCVLTWAEDRTWGRDLAVVVSRLNQQHRTIQRLIGILQEIKKEAIEAQKDEMPMPTAELLALMRSTPAEILSILNRSHEALFRIAQQAAYLEPIGDPQP